MTDSPPTPSAPSDAPPPPTQRRLIAIGLVGMAVMLVIAGIAILAIPAALDRARPGTATTALDGSQEITVEVANGVYSPNVIRAKAGMPLRLHVVVRGAHACSTRLLVPDLKLEFELPVSGTADLTLPPAKAGSYLFTCGERMVKGSIVLE
jgi:plastocyanin domain-containing protein